MDGSPDERLGNMPTTTKKTQTETILKDAGPMAARLLRDTVAKKNKVSREVLQTARFIIDQVTGTATPKREQLSKAANIQITSIVVVRSNGITDGQSQDIIDVIPEHIDSTSHNKDSATQSDETYINETYTVELDQKDHELPKILAQE